MTPSSGASSLVIRRLYKSLLRATKPFTSPSPNAAALTCLLHRTGIDDDIEDWKSYIQRGGLSNSDTSSRSWSSVRTEDEARDLSITYAGSSSGKTLSSSRSTAGNNTDQQQQRQSKSQSYEMLFRRLLREVMGGPDGHRRMLFPSQVEPKRLRDVIRREFRDHGNYGQDSDVGDKESTTDEAMSSLFDDQTRLQVAFVALRELNKKLAHFESLQQAARAPIIENQAARHVSPLNYNDPSSYLRPGTFLVANPNLNDSIFTKSVICILEHKIANTDNKNSSTSNESAFKRNDEIGMTYGLIINKFSINQKTGENRKLCDVFKKNLVPERIGETFVGDAIVRDGGPVHFSFQMLYSVSSSTDTDVIEEESSSITTDNIDDDSGPTPTLSSSSSSAIGGTLIPMIPDAANTSTALYSDRATYFQGDLLKAIDAVERGKIDRDDISFFVGASRWTPGQLESEILQGVWMPCRGPPEIALTGICDHEPLEEEDNPPQPTTATTGSSSSTANSKRPLADLWLSMLSACGEQEAVLAHLFHHKNNGSHGEGTGGIYDDEHDLPCDADIA